MRYQVYMERTMSAVITVEAETWRDALFLADQEGVPSHEDGDVAQDWESLSATGEDGKSWS